MERSSKRGKIPQRDWPLIIKRYEDGETLASIARTYDCSPPAISYVLSRNRGRDATPEYSVQSETESPQLETIRADPSELVRPEALQTQTETDCGALGNGKVQATDPGDGSGREWQGVDPNSAPEVSDDPIAVVPVGSGRQEQHDDVSRPTDGGDAPATHDNISRPSALSQNGEARRTLHLSSVREATHRPELQVREPHGSIALGLPSNRPSEHDQQHGLPQDSAAAGQAHGAAFLDQALRERVGGDIAVFLAAFDAALAHDSVESRAGLRDATDRLLRAGARTRIELERLDARVPLSAREDRRSVAPAWRPR